MTTNRDAEIEQKADVLKDVLTHLMRQYPDGVDQEIAIDAAAQWEEMLVYAGIVRAVDTGRIALGWSEDLNELTFSTVEEVEQEA